MLAEMEKDFQKLANPEKAAVYQRFFRTGKGQYGEGDIFLGITVPEQRKLARKYSSMYMRDIEKLLSSKIHEHRLTSLLVLVDKYKKSDPKGKESIFNFYMKNTKKVNNWDLVDISAPNIVGSHLLDKDKSVLYRLAKSENLWDRRISIISTLEFIRKNSFIDTLKISELLLNDRHDLIHKAVGWMLREVGKRDLTVEEKFLMKFHKKMPRTTLRYAIERMDEGKRKSYMAR